MDPPILVYGKYMANRGQKKNPQALFSRTCGSMAGDQGVEPRLPDPESGVLPLHQSPTATGGAPKACKR